MQSLVPSGLVVSQLRSQAQAFLLPRQLTASFGGGPRVKDYAKANKKRNDRMDGYGKVSLCIIGPFIYMVLNFMKEIIFTFFGQKNIVLTKYRVGLSRSAIFLFVFVIVHAVGN